MSGCHRRRGTTSDPLRGSLSRRRWWVAVATGLALAFGAAPAQAAPFAYVTSNSGPPDYTGEVLQYDIAGGQLTPLAPPFVAEADPETWVADIAVSPDGKSVYVTGGRFPGFSPGEVSQYDVEADGTLSQKNPATVATGDLSPEAVAVSPDGKSVYVTASRQPATEGYQSYVIQYDVGADGTLSQKSPAVVADPFGPFRCTRVGTSNSNSCTGEIFLVGEVAVSPDGQSVYVAGYLGGPSLSHLGFVVQYDVGAGGVLSPKSPPTVRAGNVASGIAVSPDGRSAYVTGIDVSQFDIGADGALSPKTPATVAAGSGPSGIAMSPDGRSAYVTDIGFGPLGPFDISQYDVGAGGALSPKNPAMVPTGNFPEDVAISPDGRSAYVTGGPISQYDIGAGGALSPKSPPTVAAGGGKIAVTPLPRVPTNKEQCKNGGWRDFPQFRNQGNCISFVQTHR